MNTIIQQQIEALLLLSGDPLSYSKISTILSKKEELIKEEISQLQKGYEQKGIRIITNETHAQFATAPAEEIQTALRRLLKKDLHEELTPATTEVLAIIAYRGPMTRAEIETIRGVSSSSQIRKLLLRKLIERIPNPFDLRSYQYRITLDMLKHFGYNSLEQLPNYEELAKKGMMLEEKNDEEKNTKTQNQQQKGKFDNKFGNEGKEKQLS